MTRKAKRLPLVTASLPNGAAKAVDQRALHLVNYIVKSPEDKENK